MKANIKKYCKNFGYKFEKMISDNEFLTSKKVYVYAGMEYIPGTNKITSIPIRKISVKTVFEKHLCFSDGDIIGNGKVNQ